jgi:N-acyl-D-amino-acid deacylase
MPLDYVIRGGTIIDGTGAPAFQADIAVSGGRILDVGNIDISDGPEIIDAGGQCVSPGFIDIHSHSDFTVLVDPRAVSSITQGVTTELVGNCGYGCCPIGNPSLASMAIYGFTPDYPISWTTVEGYLSRLEEVSPAVNIATLVPNGQLRLATVGLEERPATPDELGQMKELLRQGLEHGAFGYSTGLEYPTETGATEAEVATLCQVVAMADGLYATHTRNRDDRAVEAVAEAIRTAQRAEVRLQISHITPRTGWAATRAALETMDNARRQGLDVGCDMHTRLFGTTYLRVVLPAWALHGSRDDVARRLRSPVARAEMKNFRSVVSGIGDWRRVIVFDDEGLPGKSRRSVADIAQATGVDPLDCVYDMLLSEIDQLERPMALIMSYTEDLLRFTYDNPTCCVASDATAIGPDGPLADATFHGAYTWASWFYRRMVRESSALSAEQAIHKLTGLPAARMQITDRGVIRKGACADIAIFDPDLFGDRGTTFEPNQTAIGMTHVFVNGVRSLRDGALTGERGGQVLRS